MCIRDRLSCDLLNTLDLSGSEDLFKDPNVVTLFCAALRHSKVFRLLLDGCGIDDQALKFLAATLTGGCLMRALDIGWNPYTADGLTEFLRILIFRFMSTGLTVLSTSIVTDEHRSLVEEFNILRRRLLPSYTELHIGCKNVLCSREKQRNSKKIFITRPQFIARKPHH